MLPLLLIGGGLALYGVARMLSRYGSPFPPGTDYRISSRVGPRISPIDGTPVDHDGVDLATAQGTPILSVSDGTVESTYTSASGGNVAQVIETGGRIRWLYLHMVQPSTLRRGAEIKRGDLVGYVGSTGRSTGPHLHLEANDATSGAVLDPEKLGVPL